MKLKKPPILKGFFDSETVIKAREKGDLLTANVYFYPDCVNYCLMCAYGNNRERIITERRDGGKRERYQMSLDDYSKLFKDIAAVGAKTIFVPGMGEPFLRSNGWDFVRYIEAANDQGLHVIVISSLNPEPSDDLVAKLNELDVSIIAKLESMIPDRFREIVRPKKEYDFVEIPGYGHVTAGIKKLMDAGFNDPNEMRLGSGTVMHNINKDEASNIFRFYRDHNIWPYMQPVAPIERATQHPELYKDLDKLAIFEELLKIDQEEYGYTWDSHSRRVAFDFIYPTIIVEFGGEIRFNAFFRNHMGNVLDDNGRYEEGAFQKVANSKLAKWLRSIYFPIGGDKGCCVEDITQCKKTILDPEIPIPEAYLDRNPNDYCIFSVICPGALH